MKSMRHPQRNYRLRERGQAAFIAIVFCLLSMVAIFLGFNTWQLSNAKTKLANTADAVAFSAALMQARDYNFSAYVNRAMVANQVTVAQLISLRAWIDSLTAGYALGHPVDVDVQQWARVPETWVEPKAMADSNLLAANEVIEELAYAGVNGLDTLDYGLSAAAGLYHVATVISTPLLADQIAHANEPNSYVDGGYFLGRGAGMIATWILYTQNEVNVQTQIPGVSPIRDRINTAMSALFGANSVLSSAFNVPGEEYMPNPARFANVVTDPDTLDSFVKSRNSVLLPFVASTLTQSGCPDGGGVLFLTLEHAGGTNLQMDGWQALDGTQANGFSICVIQGIPIFEVYNQDQGNGGAANGNGISYTTLFGYGPFQNLPGPGVLEPGLGNLNVFGDVLYNPLTLFSGWDRLAIGPGPSLDGPYATNAAGEQGITGSAVWFNRSNRAGLLPFQDLLGLPKPATGQDDTFNRCPTLTFEVSRPSQSVQLFGGTLSGSYAAIASAPNGLLRALSSSSCYFIRPNGAGGSGTAGQLRSTSGWARADGSAEYPSLYNPYWQSSLVATSAAVSTAARQALVSGQP